jgi:hypothetical protein
MFKDHNCIKKLIVSPKQINSKIFNASFSFYANLRSGIFSKSKMTILFSEKKAWAPEIIKGFRFTQHQITFAELSAKNIADHDLVVPLTIDDLKLLSEIPLVTSKNPLPIPSIECIELCDDKYRFNRTIVANGFGDYIPQMGGSLTYPYILKKRIDDWGKNCFIISDKQQEQTFSDRINHPDFFCQKLIPGTREYATHILVKNNKILHSLNIEYGFSSEFPIKGKQQFLYTRICRCPYLDLFSDILNSIEFEGLCCVNYKTADNKPQIIEINPRFGGSLSEFFFSFIKHLD